MDTCFSVCWENSWVYPSAQHLHVEDRDQPRVFLRISFTGSVTDPQCHSVVVWVHGKTRNTHAFASPVIDCKYMLSHQSQYLLCVLISHICKMAI